MRQLMIFAVVLVVLGGAAARYADQAVSSPRRRLRWCSRLTSRANRRHQGAA